jgi:poly(3-hydroxyoctanoate) depolymerase
MGFKGCLILILGVVFLSSAQAKMSCSSIFAKNTVDLINSEFREITVAGQKRELLIFHPKIRPSTPAPVVLYFHGTDVPVEISRPMDSPYGLAHENIYIQTLTDAGFVVLTPTANRIVPFYVGPPVLAWEANVYPYSGHFTRGRDFLLTEHLLNNLEDFSHVPIDRKNIFLSGFSSGGYMSSRLAQEARIAEQIRGIVVHSASYGECLAGQCYIPADLPDWHPQTLLVSNKDDSIVPFSTVEYYKDRLSKNGIPVKTHFSESGDHAWKKNHSEAIVEWLQKKLAL